MTEPAQSTGDATAEHETKDYVPTIKSILIHSWTILVAIGACVGVLITALTADNTSPELVALLGWGLKGLIYFFFAFLCFIIALLLLCTSVDMVRGGATKVEHLMSWGIGISGVLILAFSFSLLGPLVKLAPNGLALVDKLIAAAS